LTRDNRGPSKEQLLMWERRPSRNLGKFLAVARPRSGINTLMMRVRPVSSAHSSGKANIALGHSL
jgi:hypothetical protein